MTTVKEQETKNKSLREHLIAYIEELPEMWTLGALIASDVLLRLGCRGIHTTGEVLAKELRRAARRGDIQRRIRPGTKYVEYTAIEKETC